MNRYTHCLLALVFTGLAVVGVPVYATNPYEESFLKMLPKLTESYLPIQSILDSLEQCEQDGSKESARLLQIAADQGQLQSLGGSYRAYFSNLGAEVVDLTQQRTFPLVSRWINGQPTVKKILSKWHALSDQLGSAEAMWNTVYQKQLILKYAYAVPNDDAIQKLKHYAGKTKGIVEVGAGSGYWAHLLHQEGVDVLAYDNFSWGYKKNPDYRVEVQHADAEIAGQHPDRMLMMVYPPQSDMALRALSAFRGQYVAYVGEFAGASMRNMADDAFEAKLKSEFDKIEDIKIPNWPGMHVSVIIVERKANTSSVACALPIVSEKTCQKCHLKGDKVCSRCQTVRYCSAKCQKDDWKQHKKNCKPFTSNSEKPGEKLKTSKQT